LKHAQLNIDFRGTLGTTEAGVPKPDSGGRLAAFSSEAATGLRRENVS
jgi:hypothetical protein